MKISNFTKGLISVSTGSFFWGFLGTIYFQYISFIGFFEVVVHRSIWTLIILIITTTILRKWKVFKEVFVDKKKNNNIIYVWIINFRKLDTLDLCCLI